LLQQSGVFIAGEHPMNLLLRPYLQCLLLLALTACANTVKSVGISTPFDSARDPDAAKLIAMSEQAMQIAQKESEEIALRQVDTDLSITAFRFVDSSLIKEIVVVVPEPNAPPGKWNTTVNSVSPLLMYADTAMDLENLRIGPNRVAQAITAYWPGCTIRTMTLFRENDKLVWTAFCTTSEGVVSGSMDNQMGVFKPSDAPPASLPPTAKP
jgi:hypothetical protein